MLATDTLRLFCVRSRKYQLIGISQQVATVFRLIKRTSRAIYNLNLYSVRFVLIYERCFDRSVLSSCLLQTSISNRLDQSFCAYEIRLSGNYKFLMRLEQKHVKIKYKLTWDRLNTSAFDCVQLIKIVFRSFSFGAVCRCIKSRPTPSRAECYYEMHYQK